MVIDQAALVIKSPSITRNVSLKANSMAGKAYDIYGLVSQSKWWLTNMAVYFISFYRENKCGLFIYLFIIIIIFFEVSVYWADVPERTAAIFFRGAPLLLFFLFFF